MSACCLQWRVLATMPKSWRIHREDFQFDCWQAAASADSHLIWTDPLAKLWICSVESIVVESFLEIITTTTHPRNIQSAQADKKCKKIRIQSRKLVEAQIKLFQLIPIENISAKHFDGKSFQFIVWKIHRLERQQLLEWFRSNFVDAIVAEVQRLQRCRLKEIFLENLSNFVVRYIEEGQQWKIAVEMKRFQI